ncbi:hypothetical protein BJ742DRAFT_857400 [Cladochytrium replicatum]|nr:hypothetical protein BJ742DRAFT_857400 [Cladochytrium replicatum]
MKAWSRREIKDVSSATALQLKAELARQKEQFAKDRRVAGDVEAAVELSKPLKPKEHLNKSSGGTHKQGIQTNLLKKAQVKGQNKGVNQRAARDEEQQEAERPNNEAAFVALARKAELYAKIRSGEEDEDAHAESLVDFVRKNHDHHNDGEDEEPIKSKLKRQDEEEDPWVEVIDEFGRTRVVRESEKLKRYSQFVMAGDNAGARVDGLGGDERTMWSADMIREEERKAWEARELEEIKDGSSGDKFYDRSKEIRNMGVGYYQFSQDKKTREAQMKELERLRKETLKGRDSASSSREKRKEMIEERRKLLEQRAKRRRVNEKDVADSARKITATGQDRGNSLAVDDVDSFLKHVVG